MAKTRADSRRHQRAIHDRYFHSQSRLICSQLDVAALQWTTCYLTTITKKNRLGCVCSGSVVCWRRLTVLLCLNQTQNQFWNCLIYRIYLTASSQRVWNETFEIMLSKSRPWKLQGTIQIVSSWLRMWRLFCSGISALFRLCLGSFK